MFTPRACIKVNITNLLKIPANCALNSDLTVHGYRSNRTSLAMVPGKKFMKAHFREHQKTPNPFRTGYLSVFRDVPTHTAY